MMTNEEILKEVKNTFRLEGAIMTKEQEEKIIQFLTGEVDLETLINDLTFSSKNSPIFYKWEMNC